jgi:hypothetical protein
MQWWQLPGPSSFISEIVSDLREGKNVLVWLPDRTPVGLRDATRSTLCGETMWRTLACESMMTTLPLEWLHQTFSSPETSPTELHDMSCLLRNESFVGQVIWLDGLDPARYACWIDFLSRYAHSCRGVELLRRTVFCLPLCGTIGSQIPSEDVCLSVRKYQGKVTRVDMQLFIEGTIQRTSEDGLLSELKNEIIVSLTLWDSSLAKYLASKSLYELFNVEETIKSSLYECGWIHQSGMEDQLWEKGISYRMNGKEVFHPFICNPDELRHRIWRAQLRVLYPFVEEQRQIILNLFKNRLSVPYTTRFGETIRDVHDLEIGHIESILTSDGRFTDRSFLNRISKLRTIRNALAHMDIVDSNLIMSEAVQSPLRIK